MPGGRPSEYTPEYHDERVFKLALLGLNDKEIASVFEVSEQTLNAWKNAHPEFLEALTKGKDDADAKVASKLYRRAMGYEHKAVKIVADAKTGAEHIVEYIERYPPDTTAAIFWLKNRQRDKWRDRRELDADLKSSDGSMTPQTTEKTVVDAFVDILKDQTAKDA